MGCPISKKMKEPQIREMLKIPCTTYNNTKMASKKRGKMGGGERNSKFSTVAEGMGAERPRKKGKRYLNYMPSKS